MAENSLESLVSLFIYFKKIKTVFDPDIDLNMNELIALGRIYHTSRTSNSCISNAEIQDALHVTKSAVSQMFDTLEDKGYIERKTDTSDRRRMNVTITPKGERILLNMHQKAKRLADEIFIRMGEEKIRQMLDLLGEYTDVFIEVHKEALARKQAEAARSDFGPNGTSGTM